MQSHTIIIMKVDLHNYTHTCIHKQCRLKVYTCQVCMHVSNHKQFILTETDDKLRSVWEVQTFSGFQKENTFPIL